MMNDYLFSGILMIFSLIAGWVLYFFAVFLISVRV